MGAPVLRIDKHMVPKTTWDKFMSQVSGYEPEEKAAISAVGLDVTGVYIDWNKIKGETYEDKAG